MTFTIKRADPDDCGTTYIRHEASDNKLRNVLRRWTQGEYQYHKSNNIIVHLRLSLMCTFWERKGYLDLPYIDSVIRQTLENFKNKHKTQIKKEYWGVLARECWAEIDHAARVEADQEREPVDIGEDDIDAWINSEI